MPRKVKQKLQQVFLFIQTVALQRQVDIRRTAVDGLESRGAHHCDDETRRLISDQVRVPEC